MQAPSTLPPPLKQNSGTLRRICVVSAHDDDDEGCAGKVQHSGGSVRHPKRLSSYFAAAASQAIYRSPRISSDCNAAAVAEHPSCSPHPYDHEEEPLTTSMCGSPQQIPADTYVSRTSRWYRQLAGQHFCGSAADFTPHSMAEATSAQCCPIVEGGTAFQTPASSTALRYTDPKVQPSPSARHGPRRREESQGRIEASSAAVSVVLESPPAPPTAFTDRTATQLGSGVVVQAAEVSGAMSTAVSSQDDPTSSSAAVDFDAGARHGASILSLNKGTRTISRAHSEGTARNVSTPSCPFRRPAAAAVTGIERRRLRSAQWAVKLIERMVAQIAVQQAFASTTLRRIPPLPSAAPPGRSRYCTHHFDTAAPTVAALTAAFLASSNGLLRWRPAFRDLLLCVHRYQCVSPTCALFHRYLANDAVDGLQDFFLFCRLCGAADLATSSVAESRRVPLAQAGPAVIAESCMTPEAKSATRTGYPWQTIVLRRYVEQREVIDLLQRMLQRVLLQGSAAGLGGGDIQGSEGSGVYGAVGVDDRIAAVPSRLARHVHFRSVIPFPQHAATVPERRNVTPAEMHSIIRLIRSWVEETPYEATSGRDGQYGDDSDGDAALDWAGAHDADAQQQRHLAFDRPGWVDAYALVQATMEAVKAVCYGERHHRCIMMGEDEGSDAERIEQSHATSDMDATQTSRQKGLPPPCPWDAETLERRYSPCRWDAKAVAPCPSVVTQLKKTALHPSHGRRRHQTSPPRREDSAVGGDPGDAGVGLPVCSQDKASYGPTASSDFAAAAPAVHAASDAPLCSLPPQVTEGNSSVPHHNSPAKHLWSTRLSQPWVTVPQQRQHRQSPSKERKDDVHHPYVARLRGNQRWADVQKAVAAAAAAAMVPPHRALRSPGQQRRAYRWHATMPNCVASATNTIKDPLSMHEVPMKAVSSTPTCLSLDAVDMELRWRRGHDLEMSLGGDVRAVTAHNARQRTHAEPEGRTFSSPQAQSQTASRNPGEDETTSPRRRAFRSGLDPDTMSAVHCSPERHASTTPTLAKRAASTTPTCAIRVVGSFAAGSTCIRASLSPLASSKFSPSSVLMSPSAPVRARPQQQQHRPRLSESPSILALAASERPGGRREPPTALDEDEVFLTEEEAALLTRLKSTLRQLEAHRRPG